MIVPTLYHNNTGRSLNVYLFLLSKLSASYRFYGILKSLIYWMIVLSYYWSFDWTFVVSSGWVNEG